jgi:hypothetical protein
MKDTALSRQCAKLKTWIDTTENKAMIDPNIIFYATELSMNALLRFILNRETLAFPF